MRGLSAPAGVSCFRWKKADRAWRRVGALDRVGFTVEDRDPLRRVYYVRYVDPEVDVKKRSAAMKHSLAGFLAFWKRPDVVSGSQYRIHEGAGTVFHPGLMRRPTPRVGTQDPRTCFQQLK